MKHRTTLSLNKELFLALRKVLKPQDVTFTSWVNSQMEHVLFPAADDGKKLLGGLTPAQKVGVAALTASPPGITDVQQVGVAIEEAERRYQALTASPPGVVEVTEATRAADFPVGAALAVARLAATKALTLVLAQLEPVSRNGPAYVAAEAGRLYDLALGCIVEVQNKPPPTKEQA